MNSLVKLLTGMIGLSLSVTSFAIDKPFLDIQHWQTQQGTQVYFVPAPEIPMLDVLVGFYAGSSRDDKQLGLAALTSKSLASGTKQRSADALAEQFAAVGAQFGINLDKDLAVISLRSLTNPAYLNPAISQFIEILQQPSFPEASVNRERDNLLAILKYQQQQPNLIANQTFDRLLYQTHPYANPEIGTPATIAKLSQSAVKAFYQRYYVAQNALIVMVGAQTLEQAKTLAEKISSSLPKGTKAPAITTQIPKVQAQLKEINFPAEQTHIVMGQTGIAYTSPDFLPLTVANYILGGHGFSSILFQEIRKNRGLTYGAYSQFSPLLYGNSFTITLATRNEQAKEAITATQELLQNYKLQGPDTKQLALAKQFLIGNLPLQFANNSAIATALLRIAAYQLPLNFYDNYKMGIEKLDLAAIHKAWQQQIHSDQFITISLGNHAQ